MPEFAKILKVDLCTTNEASVTVQRMSGKSSRGGPNAGLAHRWRLFCCNTESDQEAEHLAKRKELWEERSSGPTCPTGGGAPGENKQFARETPEATGISKRTVNRATARAREVCPQARDMIRGTKLDKGTYLDALKALGPSAQVIKVQAEYATLRAWHSISQRQLQSPAQCDP